MVVPGFSPPGVKISKANMGKARHWAPIVFAPKAQNTIAWGNAPGKRGKNTKAR